MSASVVSGVAAPGVALSMAPSCLIVEDQALLGLALEAYLEEMGFGLCETTSSAKGALEWLSVNTPSIAIIDYFLADGPCTALTRALRQREIPFVIYSGHRRSVAPAELQDVPWLTKPCDRLALLAALHRMLPALAQQTGSVAA